MNSNKKELVQSLKHIAGKKFTWFTFLMACLTFTAFTTRPDSQADFDTQATAEAIDTPANSTSLVSANTVEKELPAVARRSYSHSTATEKLPAVKAVYTTAGSAKGETEAMLNYAHSLMGTPYNYGGTTQDGFDCSGFIYHVYSKYDIEMERSSRAQSTQGTQVAVAQVTPGDLLFFTGTDPEVREVGHVGIVISEPGQPISFIHSSSNGGVKISDLEGYYTTRFMFAKRVY